MINKVTIELQGEALKGVKQLGAEYQRDLAEAVAMALDYAYTNRHKESLQRYNCSGVVLVSREEDVYDIGQLIGAGYYDKTVYGHVVSQSETEVLLTLTARSREQLGGSHPNELRVQASSTFPL